MFLWNFGWKNSAGLVSIGTMDKWLNTGVHIGVQTKYWQWGYSFDGYYDGAPMSSFGLGPLFLVVTFGWAMGAEPESC